MSQTAEQGTLLPFEASDWKIGIVTAQFNKDITTKLTESALARAADYSIATGSIAQLEVAGAAELPLVLQQLALTGSYDALLAIGCVIKGETAHFEYVCRFVSDGVLKVQLKHHIPIAFGVLMCDTKAQAEARSKLGADHLDAILHQTRLLRTFKP